MGVAQPFVGTDAAELTIHVFDREPFHWRACGFLASKLTPCMAKFLDSISHLLRSDKVPRGLLRQ